MSQKTDPTLSNGSGTETRPEVLRRLTALGTGVRALPSILAADFARLGPAVDPLVEAGAQVLHVDVMDGHFVPNISLGVPVVAGLRRYVGAEVFLDTHLMISNPLEYFEPFAKAGSDLCTLHVECSVSPASARSEADRVGIGLGAAIKPGTPLENNVRRWAPYVDLLLIMSVEPGFGGQSFIPESNARLARAAEICKELGVRPILEVDGGIDSKTAPGAVEAGVQWLVAGSSIFGAPDPVAAYRGLAN